MSWQRWVYTVPLRLRSIFRRHQTELDLDDEFQFHVEERTREGIAQGLTPEDARRAARNALGGVTQRKEECRDMRHVNWIENSLQDLRYARRTLARQPAVAAVISLTLALGIGANAAIFGLIDGLWFHPLGVREPSQLVRLFSVTQQDREGLFSYPEYRALAEQTNSLAGLAACGRRGVRITAADGTHELLLVNVVSENFFHTLDLGTQPAAGRLFDPGDTQLLRERAVVVLGHSFWQRRFQGSPSVIGQTLRVDRGDHEVLLTILGVLPPTFRDIETGADRDLWLPAETAVQIYGKNNFSVPEYRWFSLMGRLAPGASPERVRGQVATVANRLSQIWPSSNKGREATVVTDLNYRLRRMGTNGIALAAVALLVVILCCANVASLLLARNLARETEFAIRLALGVDRLRLIRQLMTENALLALLGLVMGLALAIGLIGLLPALFVPAPGITRDLHFAFDGRVLAVSVSVALAALALFGMAPAWRAWQIDPAPTLKGSAGAGSEAPGGLRLRRKLVMTQIGISLVLVAGSGVLIKSLVHARSTGTGLTREPLLLAWLAGAGRLPESTYREALSRVSKLPGIERVAVATRAPLSLSGGGYAQRIRFPERPELDSQGPIEVKFNSVSANYFELLGIPVVRGRGFDESDQERGPLVALVSERAAERFWPGKDALGRTIHIGEGEGKAPGGENPRLHRIVGIVRDAPINQVGEAPEPYIYLPFWRDPTDEVTLIVDAGARPVGLSQQIREALVSLSPRLDPYTLTTLDELVRYSTVRYQLTAELVAALGLVALLLTAVGLYGVVSFGVQRRVREIGLRVALGAERRQVLVLVLEDVGRLAAWGIAIGLPCALVATRLASALLFGVSAWDTKVYLAALTLVLLALLVAGLGPATRATRIEPMTALRHE